MNSPFHVAPPRESQLIQQTLNGVPLHRVNEAARRRYFAKARRYAHQIEIRGRDGITRSFNELGTIIRADRERAEEETGWSALGVRICLWALILGAAGTVLVARYF